MRPLPYLGGKWLVTSFNYPPVTLGVSPSLFEEFLRKVKNLFRRAPPGLREMGDAKEFLLPAPNYNTPVKDLAYKDLLTSTFTLADGAPVAHRCAVDLLFTCGITLKKEF